MATLTIPGDVIYQILYSPNKFGQIDWEGRKYVFVPNNEKGGYNPTHLYDRVVKIGKQLAEGKITLIKKVYLREGIVDPTGGEISLFIYKIRDLRKK
jgi:hypothetical protein